MKENWVQTWGQSHSALSFFYYPACEKTFRLVMHSAIGGSQVRVRFSNKCGKQEVTVGTVSACVCNSEGTFLSMPVPLTVGGSSSFTLGKGKTVTTDAAAFSLSPGEYFCVNLYVEKGSLTSGNLLSNVNLITAKGRHTDDRILPNEPRTRDSVRKLACKVLGMFLHKPIPLFDSVELLNGEGAKAIVVFGDSISQQGFWTNALDKRIREAYPGRYSVVNKSIMGNRVLRDYSPRFICKGLFGQRGTKRIEDDVFSFDNISHVVFSLGINDFLQYGTITTPKSEKPDPKEVCEAIRGMTADMQSRGIKVIMLTFLAFGDFMDYRPEKEVLRHAANTWLRENRSLFDGFYDQAERCKVPGKEGFSKLEYLGPDKLHPNEAGGQYIADGLDISFFE